MKFISKLSANKRQTALIALVIVFVVSGASLLISRHNKSVVATTDSLKDRPVAKRSYDTKLSFKDKKKLPKTYTPGEKFNLAFVIENHEGKSVEYPFVVKVNGVSAAEHSLVVKDKTDQTVEQAFLLPTDQQALTIEVSLSTYAQPIQFTMNRK